MFYITGDTHGDFKERYEIFTEDVHPDSEDVMIVLGDAGLNYYENNTDRKKKQYVSSFPFTTFCIHGNHEKRPERIRTYTTKEFCGGTVWYEPEFPNILFARDGEIYNFDGNQCIVIGGAYSIDKEYRILRGYNWFPDEQPSEETKAFVEQSLESVGNKVDIVLSHTCPVQYEPIEMFLSGIDQRKVDKSTEEWLGEIEKKITYKKWYCGHYHTTKCIDKMRFLYTHFEELNG